MKSKDARWDTLQAEYLLEYDRRKIQDCADIFRNLAGVFTQMESEEVFWVEKEMIQPTEEEEWVYERERREKIEQKRVRDSRKSFAEQMRQLAELLQDAISENVHVIRLSGHQERQIVRALAGEGIMVSDICMIRGKDGRMELSVLASAKKEMMTTAHDIAGYLSVLMNLRLTSIKRNPFFLGTEMTSLYFQEEPDFSYLTGVATAIKEGERISGDSFSVVEQDGFVTVLLSDGVGCGEKASADSLQVVELAEQVLEAGLSGQMAVKMLNSMMRTQAKEERMSTLDLCRVDLRSGMAQFVKAGGIYSFIKRGQMAEFVGESALPLGFAEEERITESVYRLEDGDCIVLLSDGVWQEWDGDDWMEKMQQMISRADCLSPQDLANRILHYAITQSHGKIRDDMTVIVLGVWSHDSQNDGL